MSAFTSEWALLSYRETHLANNNRLRDKFGEYHAHQAESVHPHQLAVDVRLLGQLYQISADSLPRGEENPR